jgi:uncharacterized protein YoxC
MTDLILGIGVGVFVLYAGFNIAYLVSVKRTSDDMRAFLKGAGDNVNETLRELRTSLENLRRIIGNVNAVTADVREISDAAVGLERSVQDLIRYVKQGIGQAAEANIAGLKAGISTGVATLVKNLQQGRSDDHGSGA